MSGKRVDSEAAIYYKFEGESKDVKDVAGFPSLPIP